jgi:hypothetical protein
LSPRRRRSPTPQWRKSHEARGRPSARPGDL